jgi:hypothetical protein
LALGKLRKSKEAMKYFDKALAIDPNPKDTAKSWIIGSISKQQRLVLSLT